MAKGKNKKSKKGLLIFISVVIVIAIVITGANLLSVQNLLKKGNSYNKIENENQLVAQKMKTDTGISQPIEILRLCT